ncbi:MAG: hypothetical protein II388_06810 [Clostridia bacterium]|nr:hypothetical protein [Clostridia bacterium]
MTDKQENTAPAADQNEQGSEITPDTQEVLQETSHSKRALPSINFDVPTENTPQRQLTAEEFQESVERVSKSLQKIIDVQQEITKSLPPVEEIMAGINQMTSNISQMVWGNFLKGIEEILKAVQEGFEETRLYAEKLKPFIEKELKVAQKSHPEIKEITADDIVNDLSYFLVGEIEEAELEELQQKFSDHTDPILQNLKLIYGIVKKAKKALEVGEERSSLPRIDPKKITELQYPLDKVNASLWGLIPLKEATALKAESDKDGKKGKQASIYVLLDFDELDGVKISRQLTSYDKRVFIAVANLKAQGHDTITAEQIYKAMGNPKRPNADTIKKILQSVECISRGRVTIDNTEEAKMYTRYDRVKATFPLLTTEICSGYANGKVVDNAIKVLEIPRLLTFAEKRGQLTTVPLRLLESPISKTEANLLLEDYLFNRIARMRNSPKITRTILLETVYQKCNVTSKMQKSRLPEKLERLLQFYKDESWITGFTITERSIEIKT